MDAEESPEAGVYARMLADEARRLQREARGALEQGHHTRASRLIADAQMLAEDVHGLVGDVARGDIEGALALSTPDLRDDAPADRPRKRSAFVLRSRGLRYAIGASLAISLALTEM